MTTSPLIVDYILNAQLCYHKSQHNNQDLKYWVYTVKWYSEHGRIALSREKEFHQCFKKDPSVLQLFWKYCRIDPATYTLESAVIAAPDQYIAYCKKRGSTYIRERRRVESSSAQRPSLDPLENSSSNDHDNRSVILISDDSDIEPQGAKADVDSECDSLFGDSFYVPRVSPITSPPSKSPIMPMSTKAKTPNGTESVQISRKIFHNKTGKIISKKSTMSFAYEQIPTSADNSFNGHHRPINVDKMSSIVERTRTPDMVLPAIEVLEDLPDYDEESSIEEVVTMIDELESSSRHQTPPTVILNQTNTAIHDVEMAENEPQVAPSPSLNSKRPEALFPVVDSDDESLYVAHDHVIDPSTFIPISHLLQSQTKETQLPVEPKSPIEITTHTQTRLLSPLRLSPHSPTIPGAVTETRPPKLPLEQQTPNTALSSPPISPQNVIQHTAATPGSQPTSPTSPTSPRNNRHKRATPKTPIFHPIKKPRLPLQISIPPPERSISPPPKFPSFSLQLETGVVLPLHVKDDRSNAFKEFLESATTGQREPFEVHGYYLHTDYTKFVQGKFGIRVASGYGRLWLDGSTETQIREHWASLRNDLNTRPLCLISLLSASDEAFVIFSSLSYEFRDAINAEKWSMGYKDAGLTIARVKLTPQELPFVKQYR